MLPLKTRGGGGGQCKPTIFLDHSSNAFPLKNNRAPERMVFHTHGGVWEDLDIVEKVMLVEYEARAPKTLGVTRNLHAMQLGRAM